MSDTGLFKFDAAVTATVSGTATASINEADIVSGGKTIIIDLSGDTWVAAGATFDAVRQDILDGLVGNLGETNSWNTLNFAVTDVVRTSSTRVTITLSAESAYDIVNEETVSVTVPASALVTSTAAIPALPSIAIATELNCTGVNSGNAFDGTVQSVTTTVIPYHCEADKIPDIKTNLEGAICCPDNNIGWDLSGCVGVEAVPDRVYQVYWPNTSTVAGNDWEILFTFEWVTSGGGCATGRRTRIVIREGPAWTGTSLPALYGFAVGDPIYYNN